MVSVSHFVYDASRIFKEIQKRENEAEKYRRDEFLAARCIQRWFRGLYTRQHLSRLHRAATAIQRRWRGYWARTLYHNRLKVAVREMAQAHYAAMATRIQKVWRGHRVRSRGRSMAELHKWLASVRQKNEDMMVQTQNYRDDFEAKTNEILENEAKMWISFILFKLHHLIRTKHIPGIFSHLSTFELSSIERDLKRLTYKDYMDIVKLERSMKNEAAMKAKSQYHLIFRTNHLQRCEPYWHERNGPRPNTSIFAQCPMEDSARLLKNKEQQEKWLKRLHDEPMKFQQIKYDDERGVRMSIHPDRVTPRASETRFNQRVRDEKVTAARVKPTKYFQDTLKSNWEYISAQVMNELALCTPQKRAEFEAVVAQALQAESRPEGVINK